MNATELKAEVLSILGYETVTVEITDARWVHIFNKACRWWIARAGLIRKQELNIVANTTRYQLADDFKGIVEYIPLGPATVPSAMDAIDPIEIIFSEDFSQISGQTNLVDLVLMRNQNALVSNMLGGEPSYMLETAYGTDTSGDSTSFVYMHISPVPSNSGKAWVIYSSSRLTATEIPLLRPDHLEIFIEVCLAFAKIALGRIRGKFNDLQVPGGSVSLDSTQLLTEGNDALVAMEKRVYDIQDPMYFMVAG